MPKLTIDNRAVEVPPGATILEAARRLGIEIPTLCFRDGCRPPTSCLVCVVKIGDDPRLVPSCATAAEDGMEVHSETDDVRRARRTALELLLGDHLGDCLAPCGLACPAHVDIPEMLRRIAAGDWAGAIATVKRDLALPAVLGRICPAPCEKACRRSGLDGAVAIRRLECQAADRDLASAEPYLPPCRPASGKRVAVVGAGPTGLSAAYHLARHGHGCTLLDAADRPGGRLWIETTAEQLPRDVLEAEIAAVMQLGIEFRPGRSVGRDVSLDELRRQFDAVIVATGIGAVEGLPRSPRGIEADMHTHQTAVSGVFAAGSAVRGKTLVVRSVADGKEAAAAIDQYLSGGPVTGMLKPFTTKIGRMEPDELAVMGELAKNVGRRLHGADVIPSEAKNLTPARDSDEIIRSAQNDGLCSDAARCLHCDCRKLDACRLRRYAVQYGADPRRFGPAEGRRPFQLDCRHAEVVYEPGKCIACGLCVEITAAAGERLGLGIIGRGFDVRIGVPLGHSMDDALQKAAAECVAACPTGALAWKVPPSATAPNSASAPPEAGQ